MPYCMCQTAWSQDRKTYIFQATFVVGANARLIVGDLLISIVLHQTGDKVDNIAIVAIKAIASPIEADDKSTTFRQSQQLLVVAEFVRLQQICSQVSQVLFGPLACPPVSL